MQTKLKRHINLAHPFHLLLGGVLVGLGLFLILNDQYFAWPPKLAGLFDSDFFGAWSIFNGLGLIYCALAPIMPRRGNFAWLLSTSAFLGFETALEIGHVCLGLPGHTYGFLVLVVGYLLLTFILVKKN